LSPPALFNGCIVPKRIKNLLDFFTKLTGLIRTILAIVAIVIGAMIWLIHVETNDIRHDVNTVKSEVVELRKDVSDMKSAFGVRDRVSSAESNNTSVPR